VQHRFSAHGVSLEGVAGHLEVHEALVGIPPRQALAHVLVQLGLVVLALLEPPESLGPGVHPADHGLVGKALVAIDDDLADGDPAALDDVEDHPHAAVVLGQLERLDLGGVVARLAVDRVDGGPRLLHRGSIERPTLDQLDPVLHLAFRQPVDPADRPALQQRPLLHLDHQVQPARPGALQDGDVVELSGAEEGRNRALDVAVVDRLPDHERGGADDLGGGQARAPLDDDAVDDGSRFGLGE
jgi:hypothetical protein